MVSAQEAGHSSAQFAVRIAAGHRVQVMRLEECAKVKNSADAQHVTGQGQVVWKGVKDGGQSDWNKRRRHQLAGVHVLQPSLPVVVHARNECSSVVQVRRD